MDGYFEHSRKSIAASYTSLLIYKLKVMLGRLRSFRYLSNSSSLSCKQILRDRNDGRIIELYVRNSTDVGTMGQVWTSEDYQLSFLERGSELARCYDNILSDGRTPLILDLGANIGMATRYFQENYPAAHIIGLEPDPANYRQAMLNIRPDRVTLLNAAIGSEAGTANVVDPGLGNAGLRVEAAAAGNTQVVTVNALLDQFPAERFTPFIAKIDIEGFENDLFSHNLEWIDKFPLLIVELHDWVIPRAGTSRPFLKAMAERNRDFIYRGENVFSISNTLI